MHEAWASSSITNLIFKYIKMAKAILRGLRMTPLKVRRVAKLVSGKPVDEAFFCVIAPGWLDHFVFNEYYKTEEEYLFALAGVLVTTAERLSRSRSVVAGGVYAEVGGQGAVIVLARLGPVPGRKEPNGRYSGRGNSGRRGCRACSSHRGRSHARTR